MGKTINSNVYRLLMASNRRWFGWCGRLLGVVVIAGLTMAVAMLTACGQKGALVLPSSQQSTPNLDVGAVNEITQPSQQNTTTKRNKKQRASAKGTISVVMTAVNHYHYHQP